MTISPSKVISPYSSRSKHLCMFFDHWLQLFINNVWKVICIPLDQYKIHLPKLNSNNEAHAHIMFWIKDAPTYDYSSPEEVVEFVDKYISFTLWKKNVPPFFRYITLSSWTVILLIRHSHIMCFDIAINK